MRLRKHTLAWFLSAGLPALAPAPAAQEASASRDDRWRADLDHLVAEVRFRHVAPFKYGVDEAWYRVAADDLRRRIPELSDGRVALELVRLHALLGDSHSEALWESFPSDVLSTAAVPLSLQALREGIVVTGLAREHGPLLGARVVAIEGRPVDEVLAQAMSLVSGDNDMHRRTVAVRHILNAPGVLHALGLAPDPLALEFDLSIGGQERRLHLEVRADGEVDRLELGPDPRSRPLWLRDPGRAYWFQAPPGEDWVYLQINQMEEARSDPFGPFCARLFEAIAAHGTDRLIIDLRHNPGGDPGFGWPLIHRLALHPRLNRPGHLFVVIGRGSKSAAPSFAARLAELTEVIFVGEPTGGRPNGFGNPSVITLPHSGLRFLCSQLFVQPTLEPDPRPWITPHVTAELSAEDLAAGRDPALEAAAGYAPAASFRASFGEMTADTTPADVVRAYQAFRDVHRNKWLDLELDLNALGYGFLAAGRVDEAIEVFEFNAREYPERSGPHDSLAEAYARKGLHAEAIAAYRRSFLLGRGNRNALTELERLGWRATDEPADGR